MTMATVSDNDANSVLHEQTTTLRVNYVLHEQTSTLRVNYVHYEIIRRYVLTLCTMRDFDITC